MASTSIFKVSDLESTKTGVNPLIANALAVETKVKEGTITSSPGDFRIRSAAISSALVHDVVINVRGISNLSDISRSDESVNSPPPAKCPEVAATLRASISRESRFGQLNGIKA